MLQKTRKRRISILPSSLHLVEMVQALVRWETRIKIKKKKTVAGTFFRSLKSGLMRSDFSTLMYGQCFGSHNLSSFLFSNLRCKLITSFNFRVNTRELVDGSRFFYTMLYA